MKLPSGSVLGLPWPEGVLKWGHSCSAAGLHVVLEQLLPLISWIMDLAAVSRSMMATQSMCCAVVQGWHCYIHLHPVSFLQIALMLCMELEKALDSPRAQMLCMIRCSSFNNLVCCICMAIVNAVRSKSAFHLSWRLRQQQGFCAPFFRSTAAPFLVATLHGLRQMRLCLFECFICREQGDSTFCTVLVLAHGYLLFLHAFCDDCAI